MGIIHMLQCVPLTSPPATEGRFTCCNSALGSYWIRNYFNGSAGALVHIIESCCRLSRAANFDGHLIFAK